MNPDTCSASMTQPMPDIDMTQPMPDIDMTEPIASCDDEERMAVSDITEPMEDVAGTTASPDMTVVDRPLMVAIEAAEEGEGPGDAIEALPGQICKSDEIEGESNG